MQAPSGLYSMCAESVKPMHIIRQQYNGISVRDFQAQVEVINEHWIC